jgi:hypothetical protein
MKGIVFAVFFFVSCQAECTINNTEGFSYKETARSPQGISVDTRDEEVDLEALDMIVDNLDECLQRVLPTLPTWQRKNASCDPDLWNSFEYIDRESFRVRIDETWHWSRDGLWQLTSAKAPAASCQAKGMSEHANECSWRAAVQDCDTIVVGPRFDNIADPLTKIVLGCDYPWLIPELSDCMSRAGRVI